jgi:hypothetical protein
MVQDNKKSRISLDMAEYLKVSHLTVPSKKLLLALIYLQHLEKEEWPKVRVSEDSKKGTFLLKNTEKHFCYVAHLRSLGLAPNSKSSTFLVKPINELLKCVELFDDLSLTTGRNSYVSWKFGIYPAALMTDIDFYALIDSGDIAHCNSDLDVVLLTQIARCYKMQFPYFPLFSIDPKACWTHEQKVPPIPSGKRAFVTKLRRALQKWANLKNCRLVAELAQTGCAPGITSVNIRISHGETRWSDDQLRKFHPRSTIIDVGPKTTVGY